MGMIIMIYKSGSNTFAPCHQDGACFIDLYVSFEREEGVAHGPMGLTYEHILRVEALRVHIYEYECTSKGPY